MQAEQRLAAGWKPASPRQSQSTAADEGHQLNDIAIAEVAFGVLALGHKGLVHLGRTGGLAQAHRFDEVSHATSVGHVARLAVDGHDHSEQYGTCGRT